MKRTLQVTIKVTSPDESDILIATLSEWPFYAFEQEEHILIAYVNEGDIDPKDLSGIVDAKNILSTRVIEEENWNQLWESDFKPVIVGKFAVIRAPFHEFPGDVRHDLLITPKMSFGTGHHATTRLMITMMEGLSFRNKNVLDFGTGTGVLAILAEKCGARRVLAIDVDDWSIQNTLENIHANHCRNIEVLQTDSPKVAGKFDLILANINLNVLTTSAACLAAIQRGESHLLISGFLSKDAEIMKSTFAQQGYQMKAGTEQDNWACILFEKNARH